MAKRYIPLSSFTIVGPNRQRYHYNPDDKGADGLPGYPELPSFFSKEQKASFRQIDIEVVETTTAKPGTKRASAR